MKKCEIWVHFPETKNVKMRHFETCNSVEDAERIINQQLRLNAYEESIGYAPLDSVILLSHTEPKRSLDRSYSDNLRGGRKAPTTTREGEKNMSKFFKNIKSLEQLKKEYKELAKANHPDAGGSTETMLAINIEIEMKFENLIVEKTKEAQKFHSSEISALHKSYLSSFFSSIANGCSS